MTKTVQQGVLVLCGCAVASTIQILTVAISDYPYLWLLPLTFIAATAIVMLTGPTIGWFPWLELALVGIWFVRLVVIPLLMVVSGAEYRSISPTPTALDYRLGTFYLVYEVLATSGIYIVLRAYFNRSTAGRTASETSACPSVSGRVSFRSGSYVPHALLVFLGAGTAAFPGVRERFSFFTSSISGTAREIASGYDASFSTLASIANLSRLAVPGLLIALAVKGYARRPSMIYPIAAMMGCVAVNLFYISTSRASFFVPLTAAIIVLAMAFPMSRKMILIGAGTALVLATVVVTQNKSFSSSVQFDLGDLANYLSTYLLGPKEYAVGIRSISEYGASTNGETLYGDIFGNIPVVSGLVDPANRTSQFYNWTYLGGNRGVGGGYIVPASIQSAYYVWWILGPLVTAIGLVPAMLGLRYLRRDSQDPILSYVSAFAVVVGILYHTNSFSTIAAFIAFPIVPLAALSLADGWIARSRIGETPNHERNSYRSA